MSAPSKPLLIWLKRGLSLVLFLILLYFFWPLIGEVRAAGNLFRGANWVWLAVAIVIQLVSYGFLTWLNALSLKPFSGRIGFGRLAAVLTSMAFIQIAIPSAGASGVALRVRLLGKYGYPPEESLFSLAVETLLEAFALATVAVLGVLFLLRRGDLGERDILLVGAGCLVFVYLLWYIWRLLRDRERGRRMVLRLAGRWNRIGRRFRQIDLENVEERLSKFQQNLAQFRGLLVGGLFLAAFGKVLLDVATLGAGFYLFNYPIPPGVLYTGYGLILTFSGVAALPGGIGMADAYVPVIFSWLDVPGATALVAGLTYRLIAFWLLRFIGFITWQILER
jgi:uncharacterized protein (TIRG00374 family)